jgi:hypothetical protein
MNTEIRTAARASMGDALRDTCMIVTLHIHQWSTLRTDRSLRADIAEANDGYADAFVGKKNLLAGADSAFKAIVAAQAAFRAYVYAHTLPFGTSSGVQQRGPRIVSNDEFIPLMETLGKARATLRDNVTKAKSTYVEAIAMAETRLGKAFNPTDYPTVDALDHLFKIDLEFSPMPSEAGFRGLPDTVLEHLGEHLNARLENKANIARLEVGARVKTLVGAFKARFDAVAATHVDGYDGRQAGLRQSMLTNARDLADLIVAYEPLLEGHVDTTEAVDHLNALATMNLDAVQTPRGLSHATDQLKKLADCFA